MFSTPFYVKHLVILLSEGGTLFVVWPKMYKFDFDFNFVTMLT